MMRVILLRTGRPPFLPRGISVFHSTMFHGLQAWDRFRKVGQPFGPLHLFKNLYGLAPAIGTSSSLLLTESVAVQCRGLEGVVLRPTHFTHVFCYPWKKGDFSFERDFPNWRDWQWYDWYEPRQFQHDPSLALPPSPYWELDSPRLQEAREQFPGRPMEVQVKWSAYDSKKVLLTDQWYERCGVAISMEYILADWFFKRISNALDRDFFEIHNARLRKV